ncbi:hypothetical protein IQ247_09205 [Plectonema cf. radiosum LEGE 06105]|uniref:Uncharacterized protein n=1 Tax=Plectonema cf. radiosum LEGE 06105 TaxID=945769 RepID=A0A8J7F2U4_9CYAN|nr:hypothetical protein [Plectonema radiosum]MBE9212868.1 hypothetical protein [Plectonema cf. radiosum LEGE 06105]NJN12581.1 hypothetical protein [Richelia sp. RM1_1_1]
MKEEINKNKEALCCALEALNYYADTSNWGTVSTYGHKKANRWIGEGEGIEDGI